jgi:crossover junction endodeoxyribonuclease RusA
MKPITLTLPWPVSANAYWRSFIPRGAKRPVVTLSEDARKYKRVVADLVASRCLKPITGRIRLAIELYPHRPLDYAKRMRKEGAHWDNNVACQDLDNVQKVTLDSLKGLLFDDDKWVFEIHAKRMEPDEHGARLVVHIEPMQMAEPQLTLIDVPREKSGVD